MANESGFIFRGMRNQVDSLRGLVAKSESKVFFKRNDSRPDSLRKVLEDIKSREIVVNEGLSVDD